MIWFSTLVFHSRKALLPCSDSKTFFLFPLQPETPFAAAGDAGQGEMEEDREISEAECSGLIQDHCLEDADVIESLNEQIGSMVIDGGAAAEDEAQDEEETVSPMDGSIVKAIT